MGPECDEPLRAAARGDLGPLEALLARLRHESFSEHDHLLLAVGPLLPLETTLALTEERGGDPVAHLLAGSALIAEAWKARGSGWGRSVSEDGWQRFFAHLELAREHLIAATHLAPSMPSAPALHLMVARGLAYPLEDQERLLGAALQADPGNFLAQWTFVGNSARKWEGDNARMLAFAKQVSGRAPAGSPVAGLMVTALAELALEAHQAGSRARVEQLESELSRVLEGIPDDSTQPNSRCWGQVWRDAALFYLWIGKDERAGELAHLAHRVTGRFE